MYSAIYAQRRDTDFKFQQHENVREEPNGTKTDWTVFNGELEREAKTSHQTTGSIGLNQRHYGKQY